jgi:four helix bundle protein
MKGKNLIADKTYELSLEAIVIYKTLIQRKEFILSKQLLRCSTAPGAMVQEAQSAHSRKDFIAKLEIGLKELRESIYWIRLLIDSNYIKQSEVEEFRALQGQCLRIIISIVKTSKTNATNPES